MKINYMVITNALLCLLNTTHLTATHRPKRILKAILSLLIVLVFGSMAIAETAVQTDWSGGAGISGPVIDWANTFDTESNLNWYSVSGELSLDYSAPMEHSISVSYVNVNQAFPVDVDGDGDMDVLATAGRYSPPYFFSGRIEWWENIDSVGTSWTYHTVDDNFTSAPSVSSADLDGDGDMDLIGAALGTINYPTWWENVDGSGINLVEHTIPTSIQDVSSVDTADVDGDGDLDLLSASVGYNDIAWHENVDGSGTNWIDHVIDGSFDTPYDV
ncbi:MAG: VCBS repeat-containing protein, partial [candidate division WOR-3 bacterium]